MGAIGGYNRCYLQLSTGELLINGSKGFDQKDNYIYVKSVDVEKDLKEKEELKSLYYITNKANKEVIGTDGGSTANGAGAMTWTNEINSENQMWIPVDMKDGSYTLKNFASGRFLTLKEDGTLVQLNEITGTGNDLKRQRWIATKTEDGFFTLQNQFNNQYLSAGSNHKLTLTATTAGTAQSWSFIGLGDSTVEFGKEETVNPPDNPNPPDENEDVKVTGIKLNATSKKLLRGKTFDLKAEIAPSNATNQAITWKSSNPSVATVDQNGKVKAQKPGQTVITATAADQGKVSAACTITVPYKITYKLNKGKNHKSNPTSYYNQKITLKKPTRKGYTFSGWYTDKKFKKKITVIAKTSKKDLTLYAKWKKVTVKTPTIKKVTNSAKKKMKVTIKKVTGAKGYRILYATDKKFKKGKKTVFTKTTSKTITKLKKGKTYYVKVCAYKLDSKGSKVYGKYSKVKKVKIKK